MQIAPLISIGIVTSCLTEGIDPSVHVILLYYLLIKSCQLLLQASKQFSIFFAFFFCLNSSVHDCFSFKASKVLKSVILSNLIFQLLSSFCILVMLIPLLFICFNVFCIYYAWWTLILLLLLLCLMDFNFATFNIATMCFPLHAVITFPLCCTVVCYLCLTCIYVYVGLKSS